jgi:hypothetical protein
MKRKQLPPPPTPIVWTRADPAALVLAIARHIDGWKSASFGWQDDPHPPTAERNKQAAIEAHAAECLRRIRAALAAGGAQQAPTDLHAAIMNLPMPSQPAKLESAHWYEIGHRDARHAAAELVTAAPSALLAGVESMHVQADVHTKAAKAEHVDGVPVDAAAKPVRACKSVSECPDWDHCSAVGECCPPEPHEDTRGVSVPPHQTFPPTGTGEKETP